MSIVIAIKEENRIVLGCDRQVSYGNLKETLSLEAGKIWQVPDCRFCYMGGVGYLRDSQIIQTATGLVDGLDLLNNNIGFSWVVKSLVPKILKELDNHQRIEKKDGLIYMHNKFIFAFADEAFVIGGDGAVIPVEDYAVIGSGEEIALGVLESNKNKPTVERIKEAIVACSKKTLYVDDNIVITPTLDDEQVASVEKYAEAKIKEKSKKCKKGKTNETY